MPPRSVQTEKTNLLLLRITKGCINKREGAVDPAAESTSLYDLTFLRLRPLHTSSLSLPHTHYITRVFSFFPFVSLLSIPLTDEIIALISFQLLWFLGASGKRSSAQPQITST